MIPRLDALEWLGDTAFVAAPYDMDRDAPSILGQDVEVDGVVRRVVGVERRLPRGPITKGEPIGLRLVVAGKPK